jgi:hypothetical protein
MSDGNFLDDLVKSIKVPADITKAALGPPAKEIGDGLGSLFYIAFAPIQRARMKKELEITRFKEDIEKELSKVAPENLSKPPLNIVGPALEASKYYIDDENIRSMFAKLIASSMDKVSQDSAHTSFVEIIKQFSPLDAMNFRFLVKNLHCAVAEIRLDYVDEVKGGVTWYRNFFPLPDLTFENYAYYSASIDNLIRLGLIKIENDSSYTDKSKYDLLKNHPVFVICNVMAEAAKELPFFKDRTPKLKEGSWSITTFGEMFAQCCL